MIDEVNHIKLADFGVSFSIKDGDDDVLTQKAGTF